MVERRSAGYVVEGVTAVGKGASASLVKCDAPRQLGSSGGEHLKRDIDTEQSKARIKLVHLLKKNGG